MGESFTFFLQCVSDSRDINHGHAFSGLLLLLNIFVYMGNDIIQFSSEQSTTLDEHAFYAFGTFDQDWRHNCSKDKH